METIEANGQKGKILKKKQTEAKGPAHHEVDQHVPCGSLRGEEGK